MKFTILHFIFWVALALTLCLMPGRYFSGKAPLAAELQQWSSFEKIRQAPFRFDPLGGSWRELLAHGILMCGVSFSLRRLILNQRQGACGSMMDRDDALADQCSWFSVFYSPPLGIAAVVGFAILIEILQSLLPAAFSRGFAWDDIIASFLGALIGTGLSGIGLERRIGSESSVPL